MIFSDIYKSPRSPLAKLRHQSVSLPSPLPSSTPDWVAEEYADLLSKDKAKQKEAVKRYLDDKVKTDWEFQWPPRVVETSGNNGIEKPPPAIDVVQPPAAETTEPTEPVQDELQEDPGYQVDDDSDAEENDDDDAQSTYSTVSEDPLHYKPRMEWASDLSDEEPPPSRSPFRFDSPDTVGSAVQASVLVKRALRRREVRKEMEWNEGLACFEARRNAWTGARTVRVRTKPVSPPALSPKSPRRFFFRRSMSGSPPNSTHSAQPTQGGDGSDGSSLAKSGDDKELRKQQTKDSMPSTPLSSQNYRVETLIPLAQPLLPPHNPLRASITPSVYLNLYEKVIIHNLTPSCPINLADMLRACVSGWKRDGEWPPRPTMAPPTVAKKKKKQPKPESPQKEKDNAGTNIARRMSFGLLGRDKDEESGTGKGIRRSLQRALGLGANGTHDVAPPTSAPAPAVG
ncbi:Fc.00g031060.m01.CDS01 [Cosmosporella sp. VM-42]